MYTRNRLSFGRVLALVLAVSLAGALCVAVAPRAAATAHTAHASKPGPVSAPRTRPDSATASAATLPAASGLASYTVSKAVYRFLHTGLGLALAGSRTLRGKKSGSTITLTVGSPASVGLPAGLPEPAWGNTTIAINTTTGSLTATATVSGTSPARLSVAIAHAHTSTLPAADLNATLSITANVVGAPVQLSGTISNRGGRPVSTLSGTLSRARVVRAGVLTVDKGAAVALGTATGLALQGAAHVGAGSARTPVAITGTVTDPRSWRLKVSPTGAPTTWSPVAGLSFDPAFTGAIVDTAGSVGFDLTSVPATTWPVTHSVSVSTTRVEYSNGTPPTGAPASTAGSPWIAVSGAVTVPSGAPDDLAAIGTVVVDLSNGVAALDATQHGTLSLSTQPSVSLHDVALHATLQTGAAQATGTVSGSGAVTVGAASPANATVTVTGTGVLVVDFAALLAPFGLGAAGAAGEILYASADIPAYTVPSTGRTIHLRAGFSTASGETAGSYTISGTAEQFLNSIGLNLPSATLHGDPAGGTITLTESAPTLPVQLPAGDAALNFGTTTITVDPASDTLTAVAGAASGAGTTGTLSVTIEHVSTSRLTPADLTATLHIADLSVLGTSVRLDGSVTYANGVAAVAVSGTLADDLVVVPGLLTVHGGTIVSLSTADGLTVSGAVDLGGGATRFTVALSGTITDVDNWMLQVTAAAAPAFQPIAGLTITPSFTGTITDTDGTVRFDVSGDNLVSWQPGASVTVSVTHVEISDQAPPANITCPSSLGDGDIWVAASGDLSYAPSTGDVHVDTTAQACLAPAAKRFTITTAAVGSLLGGPGFAVTHAILTVDGDLAAPAVTVKAAARIDVTVAGSTTTLAVGISFSSDGTFVAAAGVPDLSALGLDGSNGFLYVASKEVKNFSPSDLGIVNKDGSDIAAFDLPAGVSVSLSFTLDQQYVTALQNLHIPISGATVQLIATLGEAGFSVKIEVNFGDGPNGVTLLHTDQGITVTLDTIYIAFDLSETSTTLSLGGTAYLHIPPVTPGGEASDVEVGVDGSINVDTLTFSVGVSLSGVCHAGDCAWHDAFGITGLSVDSLSGTIGVDFETAIPTPTISLKVDNLVLPDAWARAIGMVPGTRITLGLNLSLSQPAVDIAIDPGPGSDVALTPLAIFTNDQDVVNGLIVHRADLVFAPFGATEADGTVLVPGANLVFDTTIAGVDEHVAGSIDLSPLNPSFTADVRVASFTVGPVSLQGPTLHVAIAPTAADISFSGGITDSVTGISFSAALDLGVSTSLVNAAVSLNIRGGLPQYLAIDGSLQGSVTLDETGLNVSASGHLYLAIAGFYLSAISVSYSGNASTIWRDLNNDFAAVAAAFVSAYNWSAAEITQALQSLGFNLDQIAQAIADAFNQGVAWVIAQLNAAGVAISDAVNAAIDGLDATATQVAAALQNIGYQAAQIAGMIQDAFNAGAAEVYNALVSIGDAGSTVLNAISSLFNNGSYNLWVGSAPDVLDVNGASQSAGAALIQYTWNGGTNQDWFVLPTDSGYAELVNRNSGQCLDNGGSATPSNLVQEPCSGSSTQQWYLDAYPGSGSLNGQQHVLTNRYSGLVADVTGASFWPGASVEQYYANGGSNQEWTFLPAA